jgi:hypothetical protein
MNNLSKTTIKLITVTQVLALTLLAACTTVGSALGATSDTSTSTNVCHATGDPANPYEEIIVTNDISPVPANGCPTTPVLISDGKITICHATGSETNPYEEITVSVIGLNGHSTHKGDVFPSTKGGCPTTSPVITSSGVSSNDKVTICHVTGSKKNPYTEITVSVNGLNGHDKHEGDIIPAPAGGCPTTK